jgi:hypothetical protein
VNKGLFMSLILSFCLFLTACEDPQEIGSEVFSQDIGVLFTDTLTVDASTVLLDSIVTSTTPNLLVGRYTDPTLGLVEASSYFQISNTDTIRTYLFDADKTPLIIANKKDFKWIKNPTKVDSIRFILPYSVYQGDTLQTQTFKVSQFNDNSVLDATKSYFSNSDAPLLKSNLLGQVRNVKIRPIKNKNILLGLSRFDTLRIPITDPAFISFISSQRDSNKEDALIGTGFKTKIRGMALTSESSNNAALLGFYSDYSVMKVYYSYTYSYTLRNKANTSDSLKVTVDSTKSNDLYVGLYSRATGASQNARFNKITTTRSGAFSKLVNPTNILPSAMANNQAVIQSNSGLAMKIKFPSLLKLKERQDIAINKAELVFEPNVTNYSVPNDLVLIESTPVNRLLRSTLTSEGALQFVAGEGSTASHIVKTNSYTFNVTSSLQNILSGRNKTNGWILTADTFREATQNSPRGPVSGRYVVSSEIDRAVFDSKKIKLKVYYTYIGK